MIELEDTRDLVDPVVIAAFEGWNDAGEAASATIDHLMRVWGARVVGELDGKETPRLAAIVGALRHAGFEVTPSTSILDEVWKKLPGR